jgi:CubicO group peptidase (beta-lactamase class C family)
MSRARCVLLSLLIVAAATALAAQAPGAKPPARALTLPEALNGFNRLFTERLTAQGIVGANFVLIHDHQVVTTRSFGMADLAAKVPVDLNTIFHWASITKTFTGIAIMQLRDRGRLSLDDPVVKYLPELRAVHNPFGSMEAITIRMLMSHTSGFQTSTWPWAGDQAWQPFEPQHWSQVVAMLPYMPIEFRPGSKYGYSNPGVMFLGQVIERITGDDFEVYIDKNILKPLDMPRSFFDTAPYHLVSSRSHSYFWKDGRPVEARFDFDTGVTVSNGGLNASLPDMARYVDFLIGNPARRGVYDVVLKRASLEEMWEPAADVEDGPEGTVRIGLSFFLEKRQGLALVGHSGGQNGFTSHFYVHLPGRTGYLIAFNTAAEAPGPDGRGDARLLDREFRDYLVRNVIPLLAGR